MLFDVQKEESRKWRKSKSAWKHRYLSAFSKLLLSNTCSGSVQCVRLCKEVKVTKPIKQYQQELEEEINELRLAEGKKKIVDAEPDDAESKHDGQIFHELYKKMDLSKTQIMAVDAGRRSRNI